MGSQNLVQSFSYPLSPVNLKQVNISCMKLPRGLCTKLWRWILSCSKDQRSWRCQKQYMPKKAAGTKCSQPKRGQTATANRGGQVRLLKTQASKQLQPWASNCACDFSWEEWHRRVKTGQWHPIPTAEKLFDPLPNVTQCPHSGKGLRKSLLRPDCL